jgi:hypothetical protein
MSEKSYRDAIRDAMLCTKTETDGSHVVRESDHE